MSDTQRKKKGGTDAHLNSTDDNTLIQVIISFYLFLIFRVRASYSTKIRL